MEDWRSPNFPFSVLHFFPSRWRVWTRVGERAGGLNKLLNCILGHLFILSGAVWEKCWAGKQASEMINFGLRKDGS